MHTDSSIFCDVSLNAKRSLTETASSKHYCWEKWPRKLRFLLSSILSIRLSIKNFFRISQKENIISLIHMMHFLSITKVLLKYKQKIQDLIQSDQNWRVLEMKCITLFLNIYASHVFRTTIWKNLLMQQFVSLVFLMVKIRNLESNEKVL